MNPLRDLFDLFLPGPDDAAFQAALITLLSIHAYASLARDAKTKVDREVTNLYKELGFYPWWRLRPPPSEVAQAAENALAMWRLGLPTGIECLSWSALLPPRWRRSPHWISMSFKAFDPVTDRAIQHMQRSGIQLQGAQMYGRDWLQAAKRQFP